MINNEAHIVHLEVQSLLQKGWLTTFSSLKGIALIIQDIRSLRT